MTKSKIKLAALDALSEAEHDALVERLNPAIDALLAP